MLTVGNTGDTTGIYQVEPAFFRMGQDGSLTEVSPPFPANNAERLVRFSPRQFELAPGQNQIVRIAARIPPGLPPGEYRVHLRVKNVGAAVPAPQLAAPTGRGARIQVRIRVARAVRVLVRHGVEAGRASLGSVTSRSSGGGVAVSFDLSRDGRGSSSGTYRIYTARSGAKTNDLASGRVLIYGELPGRTVERTVSAGNLRGANICVAYQDRAAVGTAPQERCTRAL